MEKSRIWVVHGGDNVNIGGQFPPNKLLAKISGFV